MIAAGSYYLKGFGTAGAAMVKRLTSPRGGLHGYQLSGVPGVSGLRVRVWIEPSDPVSLIGLILKRTDSLRKNSMLLLVFF